MSDKEKKKNPELLDMYYHLEKNESLYEDVYDVFSDIKVAMKDSGNFRLAKNFAEIAGSLAKIRADNMNAAYRNRQTAIEENRFDKDEELMRKISEMLDNQDIKEKATVRRSDIKTVEDGKAMLAERLAAEIESGKTSLSQFDKQSINNFKDKADE